MPDCPEYIYHRKRYAVAFVSAAAITVVLFFISLCTGSTDISPEMTLKVLASGPSDPLYPVVCGIRLPRSMAALILGGALAVSGFLLQSFFHNPIAGPFVMGISSGAKLTMAAAMVFLLPKGIMPGARGMVLISLAGSLLCTAFVLLMAGKLPDIASLIVAGVMAGYVCSAATDLLVTFADDSGIANLHGWSLGSLSGTDMGEVAIMASITGISILASLMLAKPMSAYRLGESYALSLGVNTRLLRVALILLSSILSSCVTAFAGPISFAGVAVPFAARLLFKTTRPGIMIPACFITGGAFCLLCDLLARSVFSPVELSISTVTAFFGAPAVVVLILKERGRRP